MSEYCNKCSPFKNQHDIDLVKIALKLKKGYSTNFICEGCNNRAVYKDDQGLLYLAKSVKGEIELHLTTIEQFM